MHSISRSGQDQEQRLARPGEYSPPCPATAWREMPGSWHHAHVWPLLLKYGTYELEGRVAASRQSTLRWLFAQLRGTAEPEAVPARELERTETWSASDGEELNHYPGTARIA